MPVPAKTSASFGASIRWPAASWRSRSRWTKSGPALTTVISVSAGDSAGQVPGHVGPGVSGAEDDDAVLHVRLLSVRWLP
ncbi:hypothetical protein SGLAM104S_10685 [Streptomyces glaucescens]